jgi:hypothetical protein
MRAKSNSNRKIGEWDGQMSGIFVLKDIVR